MAVAVLSPARALRTPRRADPRALIGVFLTLAALAGSVAFWVGSSDARPVLVATRELAAGTTLRSSDFATAYIKMDDRVYAAAVPAEALESLLGHQLGEPMHADQVLSAAQVASRVALAADQVAITIPARPDSAVDGRLRPGDAVRVLVTVADKARGEAHARTVLERAQVFEVGRDQTFGSSATASPSGAGFGSDADGLPRGSIASVTLAVAADQARQLAEARRLGELDVLLLPPSELANP
jgi:Flp pilus assembly protein CpaB